ncbi:OmpH family outer membrane protein [Sporomusa termitida]|uniref:Outer membrane protein (OmpH-like) n=1 Tax=Sporomusa termitida TaxID=2377 RepID=A0A517DYW9_9FIRM|nr:OmpH family outer membrane protein [Sporomusa termitida]QDR82542.1 Outer membrane protein (OmpH-like) [Sporomusa termitida]
MKQANSKICKQITISIAAFFAFGMFGVLTPAPVLAAKAKNEQTIGYVDRQQVFSGYPGIQEIMQRIQDLRAEAQKDYDTNTKDLPVADKKAYSDRLALQQAQREDELMDPVRAKIEAAIKAIAAAKGLHVILDAAIVIYGGTDITADVITKVSR